MTSENETELFPIVETILQNPLINSIQSLSDLERDDEEMNNFTELLLDVYEEEEEQLLNHCPPQFRMILKEYYHNMQTVNGDVVDEIIDGFIQSKIEEYNGAENIPREVIREFVHFVLE